MYNKYSIGDNTMAITRLKYHNNCEVQIVFGLSLNHYAHLECVNENCKYKSWIQWLNADDTDHMRKLGVPVVTNRTHDRKKQLSSKEVY